LVKKEKVFHREKQPKGKSVLCRQQRKEKGNALQSASCVCVCVSAGLV